MQHVNNRNKDQSLKINKDIKAKEVRLIDENGEMIGVISLPEALKKAEESNLDLVEVNATSYPPVCKIIDYGKYKYLQQKKQHEAKKKQKKVIVKKLAIHLNIGLHDYAVKVKQITTYINEGKNVDLAVELRGREMEYSEKAKELLARMYKDIGGEEFAKLNNQPKLEGRKVVAVLTPAVTKTAE